MEVSKKLQCIVMRNGIKIWVEYERLQKLQEVLASITGSKFIKFDDQIINTADITGIYNAPVLEDWQREKNGEWKCRLNNWHQRGEKCLCISEEKQKERAKYREEYYKEHGYYPMQY